MVKNILFVCRYDGLVIGEKPRNLVLCMKEKNQCKGELNWYEITLSKIIYWHVHIPRDSVKFIQYNDIQVRKRTKNCECKQQKWKCWYEVIHYNDTNVAISFGYSFIKNMYEYILIYLFLTQNISTTCICLYR